MLPKAAVLCALLALFSAGSQGNKEANVYNHHRAAQKIHGVLRLARQPAFFSKDSETCLPDSDEYRRRLRLLECDEKYIRAVFSDIETSNCTNKYYNNTELFYGCASAPNTANVLAQNRNDPCTEKCSLRQRIYVYCMNLGEENEKLDRECGMENTICGFRNGEFCFTETMYFSDSYFGSIFYECHYKSDGLCSTYCRSMLGEFIDRVGCCFHYFNSFYFHDIDFPRLPSYVFSRCGIEVPDTCNSFNSTAVPDDFLECAGLAINNSGSRAALQSGVYSIGLIIIGLIGTYIY